MSPCRPPESSAPPAAWVNRARCAAPTCGWPAVRCRCSAPRGSTSAGSRPTTSPTSATRRRSCGPTPRVVLRTAGVEVVICRNVTDVDDVLTRAAEAHGRHYDEFALSQEFLFERDMEALHVRRPTHDAAGPHHVAARAAAGRGAARDRPRVRTRRATSSSAGPACTSAAGLDRATGAGAGGGVRRRARRPDARRPVRRPRLAAVGRARPGVAEPVGLGPARLARRVRRHGAPPRSAHRSTCWSVART